MNADQKQKKVLFLRLLSGLCVSAFICGCLFLLIVPAAFAQDLPSSQLRGGDTNKFAVIIVGAGGEEPYAQQFSEWSAELTKVLTGRLSF